MINFWNYLWVWILLVGGATAGQGSDPFAAGWRDAYAYSHKWGYYRGYYDAKQVTASTTSISPAPRPQPPRQQAANENYRKGWQMAHDKASKQGYQQGYRQAKSGGPYRNQPTSSTAPASPAKKAKAASTAPSSSTNKATKSPPPRTTTEKIAKVAISTTGSVVDWLLPGNPFTSKKRKQKQQPSPDSAPLAPTTTKSAAGTNPQGNKAKQLEVGSTLLVAATNQIITNRKNKQDRGGEVLSSQLLPDSSESTRRLAVTAKHVIWGFVVAFLLDIIFWANSVHYWNNHTPTFLKTC